MDERKPKRPMYRIYDSDEECAKYESGEHYDNNGLRGKGGRYVTPANHISMTDDDIISEAEKVLAKRRREERLEQRYEEYYSEPKYNFWEDVWDDVKIILAEKAKELLEDPKKREIFLARVNNFWINSVVPTGSKIANKVKFAKDVAKAVLTNEQPKALRLLEEGKNTEILEVAPDVSYEKPFIEMTEKQRKQLLFSIALAVDALKRVKVVKRDESGNEYELTGEEREKFIEEETVKSIQSLMGSEFELTGDMRNYLFECIRTEGEKIPFPVQR